MGGHRCSPGCERGTAAGHTGTGKIAHGQTCMLGINMTELVYENWSMPYFKVQYTRGQTGTGKWACLN